MKQKIISKTTGEYCTGCGRELQVVEETSRREYDRKTGKRMIHRYRQCPKWPRNGFTYVFCTGLRTHISLIDHEPDYKGLQRERRYI